MIEKKILNETWKIVSSDIFYLMGKQFSIIIDTYSKYIEISKLTDMSQDSLWYS